MTNEVLYVTVANERSVHTYAVPADMARACRPLLDAITFRQGWKTLVTSHETPAHPNEITTIQGGPQ